MNNAIQIEGMKEVMKEFDRLEKSLDRKTVNKIQKKRAKPMLNTMKANSPSDRIAKMTAITTRQVKRPRAPRIGIRIGVINNDTNLFPTFTAPALASVLDYGTEERFRASAKAFGITIGTQSTGSVKPGPWIRPAWDQNVESFTQNCIKDYEKEVQG